MHTFIRRVRKGKTLRTNPFEALLSILSEDMKKVDELIANRMESDHTPLIPKITDHLINAGGKRIRPLLTLASANLFNYSGAKHIALAATVEFIHTATLLHDDVIDESLQRRGKPTANLLWNNKLAVLVGDFLFSRAFQLMVETNSIEILSSLANASAQISESEVLQMSLAQNLKSTEALYMKVIKGKTATLFAAACEVGGLISNASNIQVRALSQYGEALGISFQIVDDFLDYASTDTKLGKNIGDDFRERKVTLPVIRSLQNENENTNAFWYRTIGKGAQTKPDFKIAQEILIKDGSLNKTKSEAIRWSEIAKSKLKDLPNSQTKELLTGLTLSVVSRMV